MKKSKTWQRPEPDGKKSVKTKKTPKANAGERPKVRKTPKAKTQERPKVKESPKTKETSKARMIPQTTEISGSKEISKSKEISRTEEIPNARAEVLSRPETPKQKKRGRSARNRELAVVTYLFVGLFTLMVGYFIYFEAILSPNVINNPYNSRVDSFAQKVVRGSILSSDGTVLARTEVDAEGNETRVYPYANVFAHVVGYSTSGNTGIESLANYHLLTSSITLPEQIGNDLTETKSQGDNVVTTLDLELQQTAYQALGSHRGAVVVLEAETGKVLAMVSKPDYDPNTVSEKWDTLTSDESTDGVLYNRAAQGQYPPGSTFKIVTLLEYLRENGTVDDFSYNCTGSVTEDGYTIRCYNGKSHGAEDLKKAFAKSCNSAFASIGLSLSPTSLQETCDSLLFNTDLPFSLTTSKSSFTLDSGASASGRMMAAIGQGDTVVTPLHMAMLASAIANDGVLMTPYVLDHVENKDGETVKSYSPEEYGSLMTEQEAAVLTEYMRAAVEEGTASKLSDLGFEVAGKTGTAEYSSDKSKSHAWFVGFSDTGASDIVVCVLVEEAGSGSEYAVPIARQIFSAWSLSR